MIDDVELYHDNQHIKQPTITISFLFHHIIMFRKPFESYPIKKSHFDKVRLFS